MSFLPLIAASLLAPTPVVDAPAQPAWMVTEPLLSSEPVAASLVPTYDTHDGTKSSWYGRVGAGFVTTEDSSGPSEEINFDEGYLISLGVGHRFGANDTGLGFALELDGVWTEQDADSNPAVRDVNVLGFLLDGVVDYRFADVLSVYGALGIGPAWMDVGTESDALEDFDEEDGPFLAWQAKAGLNWQFGQSTAFQIGYRFLNVDDAEIDDNLSDSSFELETQMHVFELGVVFGF